MDFHLVGGFLGSGKTTAIIGAAKHWMAQGKRVGVVTNDQGKYLVDTAFFRWADVPAVEVAGGCFCCNYRDLESQLRQLIDAARPDAIFAESVGSCADLVATVVRPFLQLRETPAMPVSFSVFTDIRLLRRRLLGQPMPFSDDVMYIFDKQIEEADLLVVNKADLLSVEDRFDTEALARRQFANLSIRVQNSLDPRQIVGWTEALESWTAPLGRQSLSLDYQRYGQGESRLAWLDEAITIETTPGQARPAVVRLIGSFVEAIRRLRIPIGHLKFLIQGEMGEAKLSFTTLDEAAWEEQVPPISGTGTRVLVNARVEADAPVLRELVKRAMEDAAAGGAARLSESEVAYFHPAFPRPVHRL